LKVCKIFTFDAAHDLPFHEGKCKELHGHTYKLEVIVHGEVNKETGMVIDFGVLKKEVNMFVIDTFDHKYLNDIIPNPTAENLILGIHTVLYNVLRREKIKEFSLDLRLWETPTSWVGYP